MQRIYSLGFALGEIQGRLLAVTPQHVEKPGFFYYSHQHLAFELFYISHGQCVMRVEAETITVNAGHAILIPPNTYHSTKSVSDDISKMSVAFEISPPVPSDRKTDAQAVAAAFYATPVTSFDVTSRTDGLALCEILDQIRMLTECGDEQFVLREKLRALSVLMILGLFQKLSSQPPRRTPKTIDSCLQREFLIDEFFNVHFGRNDGAQLLAQILCVSPRQLDRILRKYYGMSYREKLQKTRLQISIDFLQTSGKSVAEISSMVGYNSPANFSVFIKHATGKTPTEIRREWTQTHRSPPSYRTDRFPSNPNG